MGYNRSALMAGVILHELGLGGEEIVHVVAQAFGLAVEGHDKATALGAIERFLRPVAYQDVPDVLLPSAIADGNPDALWRRVDGQLTRD